MFMNKKTLLQWHIDMGADEAIGETPVDRFGIRDSGLGIREENKTVEKTPSKLETKPAPKIISPKPQAPMPNPSSLQVAQSTARILADQCTTLEELKKAVSEFDGCALKKDANKTVFADGNPNCRVMVIGEAPGAQEDIQGIPFCGPSGQLLDKMLAIIGLTRAENLYISNTVFWRPPGNRQPSPEETAICLPFVEKHIALINPKLLILSGGTATTTLLKKEQSISRLRGQLYEYTNSYLTRPLPTLLTYHPSYLMRQPSAKKLAWNDMLMAKAFLKANI